MKFRRVFRVIWNISLRLWRFVYWAKSKSYSLREILKICDLIRRNQNDNVLERINNFNFKMRLLIEFFFSETTNANLNDISTYNYSNAIDETFKLIDENEIKKTIKRCKLNNVSRSNDISNRVLKVFMNKLISHFLNLFRICVELNYHSLCFKKTHIKTLKKSKKKTYTNIKIYKLIVLLNIFDKTLKSIIAQRINDLTKRQDLFSINQINERKNRNCETTLKLFIEQIYTIWNMSKNKMITFLNINVVEIYDHVSKTRLLHNLRKKRIFTWIIVWTNNFMQNRRIILVMNNDTTIINNFNVDISQNFFVFFHIVFVLQRWFFEIIETIFSSNRSVKFREWY
jgi:hypothetical protein